MPIAPNNARTRNGSADFAKALLIVLVVTGHAIRIPLGQSAVRSFIYAFHMPIFLALAGYFFRVSDVLSTLRRSFSRYVLPWLVATLVFGGYFWIVEKRVPPGIRNFVLTPWYHLWFVPCLLFFSLVIAATRKLRTEVILAGFFLPWAAAAFGVDFERFFPWLDHRFFDDGFYFAVGFFYRGAARKPFPVVASPALLLVLALGLGLAGVLLDFPGFVRAPISALACLGALGTLERFPDFPENRFVEGLARESLGVYLYHILVSRILVRILGENHVVLRFVLDVSLGIGIVLLCASVLRPSRVANVFFGALPAREKAPRDLSAKLPEEV